jgi:hypothetical protein
MTILPDGYQLNDRLFYSEREAICRKERIMNKQVSLQPCTHTLKDNIKMDLIEAVRESGSGYTGLHCIQWQVWL